MKRFGALDWIWIFFVSQPQNTSLLKVRLVNPREQFLPKLQGTLGRARIDFVGAVAHAYDARFPTGTGTAVSGTMRIDQDDPSPRSPKLISDPCAKNTGADNCHIARAVT